MSLFPKFDPWAEVEEMHGSPAKVAKVAKVRPSIVSSKSHKPAPADWNSADWFAYFDERAAVAEYERGVPRKETEAIAFEACVTQWLNSNPPMQEAPDCCIHCGELMLESDLIPVLTGDGGHIWMHDHCHAAWMRRRQAAAAFALKHMGIVPPGG